MVTVTVCVPTFNRREHVTRLCAELAAAARDGIINDDSTLRQVVAVGLRRACLRR